MLSFIRVDGDTDAFVDSRFDTPFNPKPDAFDIGNDTSRIKTLSALVVGDWGRNAVTVASSYAKETKQGIDVDEKSLRLDFGWNRRATRKLTVRASAGYERTEFDTGQDDDQVSIDAGLQYRVWRQAVLDLAYSFQNQSSTNDTVNALLNYIFTTTPLTRMYLHTLEWNERARKSFTKSGFRETKKVRRSGLDFVQMEIWRSEWERFRMQQAEEEGETFAPDVPVVESTEGDGGEVRE